MQPDPRGSESDNGRTRNDEEASAKRFAGRPQFIDFKSPLLVSLFERLGADRRSTVHLEEVLPLPRDLPTNASGSYAAECVLELDAQ